MATNPNIRPPAVAGSFYPDDPNELKGMLDKFLTQAKTSELAPKAMILPHAGSQGGHGCLAAAGYHDIYNAESDLSESSAHRVSR